MEPNLHTPAGGPRKWSARANVILGVASLFAIAVMVNYLATRHPRQFVLSPDRVLALSPVTKQVVSGVAEDVNITVFFDSDAPLFSHVRSLLEEYARLNPRLKLETVDYVTAPGRAEQVKTRHKLAPAVTDVVIFECAGRVEIVRHSALSEYDTADLIAGRSKTVERKYFNGESFFTTALLAVTNPERPKVCFLGGRKEHDPRQNDNDIGYGKLANLVQGHNTELVLINLLGGETIPADCRLLIIPGPELEFDQAAQDKLHRYLEQGGRLLVLFRVGGRSGLERLLLNWGVAVDDKRVKDAGVSKDDHVVIVSAFGSHETIQPLFQANLPLAMVSPRIVGRIKQNTAGDAPQVTELAHTSENAVGLADYREGDRPNPLHDVTGRLPLLAAVERGGVKGVKQGSTRIIVAGDSYFLDNQMIEIGGNRDFAWNAVSWLLDRSELLGIAQRPIREYRFVMTRRQMEAVRWIFLGLIPGSLLLVGWLVWLKRQI